MGNEVKVAVIGCGYWGPNLARNFSQSASASLVGVCDIDEKKTGILKHTYPYVWTTTDFREVLAMEGVDAVAIAVPVAEHFEIAREALLAGKHVLVEKPLAVSLKKARELIKTADTNGMILMVDHTFEYAQAINRIKEIVESDELGRIYYIRAEWLNLGVLQPDVNVVWDLAAHVTSILTYLTGMEPSSLSANAGAYIRDDIEEIAHVHFKFPRDITTYMTVSWLEPKKTRSITIVGSRKMLVYDLMDEDEQIKIFDKGVDITEFSERDITQFRINYRYGDVYSPKIKKIEPLREMCEHFARCIIENRTPRSDGLSGLKVVRILSAIQQSIKNGGKEVTMVAQ